MQGSICHSCFIVPHLVVKPRGLMPNPLWQMHVTHIPEFGKLKYVHVAVDTFSEIMMAIAQSGQATNMQWFIV